MEDIKYNAVCPRCGCEFEYSMSDIFSWQFIDHDKHSIDCPDGCGCTIVNKSKEERSTGKEYKYL